MKNMNGEEICGEIWTKDYQINDNGGSGLAQKTETCYCTKKRGHQGAHVATMEGGPAKEEYVGGPYHGKPIKSWVSK